MLCREKEGYVCHLREQPSRGQSTRPSTQTQFNKYLLSALYSRGYREFADEKVEALAETCYLQSKLHKWLNALRERMMEVRKGGKEA